MNIAMKMKLKMKVEKKNVKTNMDIITTTEMEMKMLKRGQTGLSLHKQGVPWTCYKKFNC